MTDRNRRNRTPIILALGAKIEELTSENERLSAENASLISICKHSLKFTEYAMSSKSVKQYLDGSMCCETLNAALQDAITKAKEGSHELRMRR